MYAEELVEQLAMPALFVAVEPKHSASSGSQRATSPASSCAWRRPGLLRAERGVEELDARRAARRRSRHSMGRLEIELLVVHALGAPLRAPESHHVERCAAEAAVVF